MSLLPILNAFSRQRVLVVGDLILDHYVRGSVSRTSVEAPVPILAVEGEDHMPGGAANVAMNVIAMGGHVELVGLAADDEAGVTLRALVSETAGLRGHFLSEAGIPTILKTRCMAQGQQMLRLDREVVRPIGEKTRAAAKKKIEKLLSQVDGVILSDYGKGFLHPELIAWIAAEARSRGLRVVVDPKGRDYARYRGVAVLTPNLKEAGEATGVAIEDDETLREAARRLQKVVAGEAIVITRGPSGVSVFPSRKAPQHLPARAREVFDVTGAGDSFIAAFGMALFTGAGLADSAEIGNLAGGIAVAQVGNARVSREALTAAAESGGNGDARKRRTAAEIEQIARSLRHHGSRMVFTNGFFDLLHHGHIRLLEKARTMGDCLVVALNSDASIRRLKGAPRPILSEDERAGILAALPFVDYLVFFDNDTPESLLSQIQPAILVKGGRPGEPLADIVGHEIVEGYGGEVRHVFFENEPSISTLIERARAAEPPKGRARRRG